MTEQLTNLEIYAWASLHGIKIHAWEIKLIKKLHDRARVWWQEHRKKAEA